MAVVYCNNTKCKHNTDQECTSDRVFYIDRLCVTYRRSWPDDMGGIMDAPFNSRCRRSSGKYRSTGTGRILK